MLFFLASHEHLGYSYRFSLGAAKSTIVGRHLVGVWIGGVWNGHFPESDK